MNRLRVTRGLCIYTLSRSISILSINGRIKLRQSLPVINRPSSGYIHIVITRQWHGRHAENRYIRSYLRIIIRKSINHVFRTRSTCRRKFFITDIYGKESPSIGRNQILDEFMPIRIPIEIWSAPSTKHWKPWIWYYERRIMVYFFEKTLINTRITICPDHKTDI